MTVSSIIKFPACSALTLAVVLFAPARVFAHCDGLDGPVVKAAQQALARRDPAPVLIWVQPKDEAEIRAALEQTLAVRALSPQAKELADRFFFETVVRVHRAGEGEPFTGLKPAGRDLGPAIPAADKAIDDRSLEPLLSLLTDTVKEQLLERFNDTVAARSFKADDVVAGRRYVQTYVEFVQYVERLYDASITAPPGHYDASQSTAHD